MIAVDYSVLVQILSFLLLWFVLSKLLFQPFLRLLEEREKRTEGLKEEADALIVESERLRTEYEDRMARAREEGEAAKQAFSDEASRVREQVLARARESAASLLHATRQRLGAEMKGARELIGEEAQAAARQMAEKVLGRRIG